MDENADNVSMRVDIMTVFCLSVFAVASGCGKTFLQMAGGASNKGAASFQLDSQSVFNNMKERCGVTIQEAADLKVDIKLKTLPIVFKVTKEDMEIEVQIVADAHMSKDPVAGTKASINMEVLKIIGTSKGVAMTQAATDKFIKPFINEALRKAKGQSSGGETRAVPITSFLTLYKEDGPFKGIFCSVIPDLGKIPFRDGYGYTFADPLPTVLNPFAAASTFASELGDLKTFNTKVTIDKAKSESPLRPGTVLPFSATVKKVSTDLRQLSGLPPEMVVPAIDADVAYELSYATEDPSITIDSIGLEKRRVFYVNTKTKKLVAAVVEIDKPITYETSTIKIPPIVAIVYE